MNAARLAQALRGALVRLAGEEPPRPGSFTEAIEWHRSRDRMLTKKAWRELPIAERQRAFTVANVTQLDLINDVWKAMDKAVDQGTTFEEFKKEVGDKLIAEWKGTVKNPAHRLETIFRTNVQVAYGAGRWRAAKDAVKTHPYWQLAVVRDNRTSDTCLGVAGIVLPADDEWWKTNVPPRHFNCRSTIRSLRKREAERIRGEREKEGLPNSPGGSKAQDGFGEAPTQATKGIEKVAEQKADAAPGPLANVYRGRAARDVGRDGVSNVPPAKAAPKPGQHPIGVPVSNAVESTVKDEALQAAVRDALGAIDAVHGDGKLQKLPIKEVESGDPGKYWTDGKARAIDISLRREQKTPGLVTVHEVGHLLDHQVLGTPGLYATESVAHEDDLAPLKAAIGKSKAFKLLTKTLTRDYVMIPDARGRCRQFTPPKGMIKYLLEDAELFGRAYAQWIAIRSKSPRLLAELEVARSVAAALYSPEYWSDEDFGPIAEAFDRLFEKRGWVTRTPVAAK